MSNYFTSIDLLKLTGARVSSADMDGKVTNVVVIPVEGNGITVMADGGDRPSRARLPLNLWQTNDRFKEACRTRHSGEEGYNPPSHSVQVAYEDGLFKTLVRETVERMRADGRFASLSKEEQERQAGYTVRRQSTLAYAYEKGHRGERTFEGLARPQSFGAPVAGTGEDNGIVREDDLPF